MQSDNADFLICGGGIIGLTVARELVAKGCDHIVILEKEETPGNHASGRNSGVLHAGIYYTPGSLRAQSCLAGNLRLKQYCREKGLPLHETGKVVVTKAEEELVTLQELYERAKKNGARVELIDERQLREAEPNANTVGKALYCYDTAVIDPDRIVGSICSDLIASGKVQILTGTALRSIRGSKTAVTSRGMIRFGKFINASGAYSDKVAHLFGVGLQYKVLPFKGTYKKITAAKSSLVRGNIYPVPDMRNPFLGVHFTRTVEGKVYVGPTAMPAFGREHYGILNGIGKEGIPIFLREAILFMVNQEFRDIALSESKKYHANFFFEDARKLLKGLSPEDLESSDKVGIRPQLVDWARKRLVMDFVVLQDGASIQILNTISPGFTSSMEFARLIVENYT